MKILSLFMVLFFALNIFSLTGIFDVKREVIAGTGIEQIFADIAMPASILGKMMSEKAQNKTPVNNKTKQDKSRDAQIAGTAVPAVIVFTMMLVSFVLCLGGRILGQVIRIIKYPLKIPWRAEIFLLLMMKILFNVRPRAGDIYGYNYAFKKGLC